MSAEEHKKYLEEFSSFINDLLSSEEDSKQFLVDAKINTPTGRLTKRYQDISL